MTIQVTLPTGETETCTEDHARACLSGHYDDAADEWSLVRFERDGVGVSPGAVYVRCGK